MYLFAPVLDYTISWQLFLNTTVYFCYPSVYSEKHSLSYVYFVTRIFADLDDGPPQPPVETTIDYFIHT